MKTKALIGIVAALSAVTARAQAPYDRYTVPVYTGVRAQPKFTGTGAQFAMLRSQVREAFAANAIVAGHYVVVQVGCGTGCTTNIVGDVRTGQLLSFPLGGEEYQGLDIAAEPRSRLFTARWGFDDCTTRTYALEGVRFVRVGRDRYSKKRCY